MNRLWLSMERGSTSNRTILRRLNKLEKVFAVEPEDDWIEILMWNGFHGGIFGHTHYRFSDSRSRTEWIPCSDKEEIEIMLRHYEKAEHKIPGTNTPASFTEFLEYYSYLGPEELDARRKKIIEQLKGEKDGTRIEDTARRAC